MRSTVSTSLEDRPVRFAAVGLDHAHAFGQIAGLLAQGCELVGLATDDRDAAIARAIRALSELEVEGIPTTRDVALDILRSREFRGGEYSTSYLAEMEGRLPSMSAEVA